MVKAELFEIRINELEGEQVIILNCEEMDRRLPIMIGICEANAIRYHVHSVHPPRPLTHDLLNQVIGTLGGVVDRIVINDLNQGTFFAQIVIETPGGEVYIDARPSDAIALAVRVDCPIYIEDHVLEKNESEGF